MAETSVVSPAVTWRGRVVTVLADGSWYFHACVVCGQPIEVESSVERGFGPDCWERLDDRSRVSRRSAALMFERARWRQEKADRALSASLRAEVAKRDGFYWRVDTGECAGPVIGWRG